MVGLGIMGSAMAANLVRGGFEVIGYDPMPTCRRGAPRKGRGGGTGGQRVLSEDSTVA